jgi:hypothetical protein
MVTSISGMYGYGFDEAELKKIQDAQFKQMDADGDGKISKEDLVEWAAGVKEKTGKTIDTEKLFKALDHNGDGAISREEFGKGPKKTAEVPTLPTTRCRRQKSWTRTGTARSATRSTRRWPRRSSRCRRRR